MKGCERSACADETRSGTCGPHRSEPVREPHVPTLFNLSTWSPRPTLFVPPVTPSCFRSPSAMVIVVSLETKVRNPRDRFLKVRFIARQRFDFLILRCMRFLISNARMYSWINEF